MKKTMKLKKRILSLVMACCMVFTIVPASATKANAGIADALTGIVRNAGTIINSAKKSLKQAKDQQLGPGEAFLGTSKNLLYGFLGIDDGESSNEDEYQVSQVDLTEVKKSLGDIQNTLAEQKLTLNELKSSITENTNSILTKLDELNKNIELQGKLNRYYTYLNTYFEFYNDFLEAVRSNERELTSLYKGNPSMTVIKNTYDRMYKLEGVKYTGNFYSSIERMGQYIRGEYASLENKSLVDILYDYYKIAGYSDTEIADELKEFIANTYYTCCLANYYYMSTALFQEGYMAENHLDEYITDFNVVLDNATIERNALEMMDVTVKSAETIFCDLNKYFCPLDEQLISYQGSAGVAPRHLNNSSMDVESGSFVQLPDSERIMDACFGSGYSQLFGDLCTYSYETEDKDVTLEKDRLHFSDNMKEGAAVKVNVYCNVGDSKVPLDSFTFTCQKGKLAGGYGTYEYPYVIKTMDQFREFAASGMYSDKFISLEADLDGKYETFPDVYYNFSGTFYGNGHTISNLSQRGYLTTGISDYGLFSCLDGGKVYDLTLKNGWVSAVAKNVGGIAGLVKANSRIERCEVVSSSVVGQKDQKETSRTVCVGGIAGKVEGRAVISKCIVRNSSITAGGYADDSVGGIAGLVSADRVSEKATIEYSGRENSYVMSMSTNSEASTGGLIGKVVRSKVDHCWNYMTGTDYEKMDSAHSDNYGTCFGNLQYVESSLTSDSCVIYNGTGAQEKNINNKAFGKQEHGNDPQVTKSADFTKNKIGIEWGCFENETSEPGNPIRLSAMKMQLNTEIEKIKTKYQYGEALNLIGVWPTFYRGTERLVEITSAQIQTSYDPNQGGTYDVTVLYDAGRLKDHFTVQVAEKPHVFEQKLEPATCEKEGSVKYVCKDCGKVSDVAEATVIPAKGHTLTHHEEIAANCVAAGQKEYWSCDECGKIFLDKDASSETDREGLVIPVNDNHVPSAESGDCTKSVTCQVCGKTLAEAAKAHNWGSWKSDKKGNHIRSCMTDGCKQTETQKCTTHKALTTVKPATDKVNGKITKQCPDCKYVLSTTTIKKASKISLSAETYTYNGKVRKPVVKVQDSSGKTISSANYTISYASGQKNVGSYDVTIRFKGHYSGTVTKTFTIVPAKTKITNVAPGKKKLKVYWKKKKQTNGYQIEYSTTSKFKKVSTVTISGNNTNKKTLSLSEKRYYYVRIRTYKNVKVNGKSTKIYSSWSDVVKKKTQ